MFARQAGPSATPQAPPRPAVVDSPPPARHGHPWLLAIIGLVVFALTLAVFVGPMIDVRWAGVENYVDVNSAKIKNVDYLLMIPYSQSVEETTLSKALAAPATQPDWKLARSSGYWPYCRAEAARSPAACCVTSTAQRSRFKTWRGLNGRMWCVT